MIRSRTAAASSASFRLLYSARTPDSVWYRDELQALSADDHGVGVTYVYTRKAPLNWPHRCDLVAEAGWPAALSPTCYVCGPTSFAEHVAGLLTVSGHHPERIRTERFEPTGNRR